MPPRRYSARREFIARTTTTLCNLSTRPSGQNLAGGQPVPTRTRRIRTRP